VLPPPMTASLRPINPRPSACQPTAGIRTGLTDCL
jgi:hypothetical protein